MVTLVTIILLAVPDGGALPDVGSGPVFTRDALVAMRRCDWDAGTCEFTLAHRAAWLTITGIGSSTPRVQVDAHGHDGVLQVTLAPDAACVRVEPGPEVPAMKMPAFISKRTAEVFFTSKDCEAGVEVDAEDGNSGSLTRAQVAPVVMASRRWSVASPRRKTAPCWRGFESSRAERSWRSVFAQSPTGHSPVPWRRA